MTGVARFVGILAVAGVLTTPPRLPRTLDTMAEFEVAAATAEQFALLPGIGPVLAERIVETRRRVGGIESVEDLAIVPGIGPLTVEAIRRRLEGAERNAMGRGR